MYSVFRVCVLSLEILFCIVIDNLFLMKYLYRLKNLNLDELNLLFIFII